MSSTTSLPAQEPDVKSVLIVILNWNSPDETLAALASVFKMNYPSYRILIVDNGSSDNSVEVLSRIDDSRVELIRSPENLGFTGGCNLGFERALKLGADYVWLLNSDSVTEVGTLASLVRTAEEDARVGLVSPLIASLQRPSTFIYAGGYFDAKTPACEMTRDFAVASRWMVEWPGSILLLGTALLVKVDLIRKIGMLDARMFAYWEDTDYSMRSNAAGFRNVVDLHSTVYHHEKFPTESSLDIRPHFWYYLARNEIRFWKRHAGIVARIRPLLWAYRIQLAHLNLLNGSQPSRQAILAGMWDGWLNRTGPYRTDRRMPRLAASILEAHSRRLGKGSSSLV